MEAFSGQKAKQSGRIQGSGSRRSDLSSAVSLIDAVIDRWSLRLTPNRHRREVRVTVYLSFVDVLSRRLIPESHVNSRCSLAPMLRRAVTLGRVTVRARLNGPANRLHR